jgi:hypothetical protein
MHADAPRLVGGGEVSRAGIVEQQERADVVAVAGVGEQRADREAVADPMRPGAAENTENLAPDGPPNELSPVRPGSAAVLPRRI